MADYDPCKYLNFSGCGKSRKVNNSSGSSQPSTSRSFSSPALVGSVRGLGIESIVWDGADFGFVSGNGRVGAGATTSNSDDTFFGNSSKESLTKYTERKASKSKYKFEKYSLSVGASLLDSSSIFSLNLGLLGRYVDSTSNFHFGAGLSGSLGPLNFSVARYKDEGIDVDLVNGSEVPVEYYVNTFSVGLSLSIISFDYTYFENTIEQSNKIEVYTGAITIESLMFSYGIRNEEGPLPEVLPGREYISNLTNSKSKEFIGLQYTVNKSFVIGSLYNYYLSNDFSLITTIFF